MAKPLKLKDISLNVNQLLATETNIRITLESDRDKSSHKFDNSDSMILAEALPIVIIIAHLFYFKKPIEQLSEAEKQFIAKAHNIQSKRLIDAEVSEKEQSYFDSYTRKFLTRVDSTRADFIKFDHVLFDSNSKEHAQCFGKGLPSKNIVIKINGMNSDVHIRLLIEVTDKSSLIIDAVNKKTKR